MSAFFVVNPRSANGRTGREWEDIRADIDDLFPNFKFAFTRGRADAVRLTRQALCDGHDEVIAVGGDGTINETINGFFELERQINPDASFGFITSGTGGDFRKSFSIDQGVRAGLARLAGARLRSIDVGRLSCLNEKHVTVKRHFINISSFGLPGVVVDAINRARIAKLFGGRFAFALHSLRSMLFFRARAVRLILDNGFD
ncbi:MAG: diacylglycerol kinase family lipid kinase, partial [Alphaproteobacteria bacterium]|nr:diacylglycerol kinase family lipid kinase [Alphaproteobacteria bacterium]